MHEATGIPKGMKFDINISPEDVDAADDDDMDGLDVSVDINLDVVVGQWNGLHIDCTPECCVCCR